MTFLADDLGYHSKPLYHQNHGSMFMAQAILIFIVHLFFAWRVYLCELLWLDKLDFIY